MRATTWIDWERVTLEFEAADMEQIICRRGWTIVDTFHDMTDVDRAELARLQAKGTVEMEIVPTEAAREWWRQRVINRELFSVLAAVPPSEH